MDRKTAVRKARAFARLARQVVDSREAYLFGSHAAGTANAESDLDIGIIVPHLRGDYLAALARLYRLRGAVDLRIEPHLIVEDADVLGLSREIVRTGIRL
ncbi:MAG: nucleotidyltransferase domain-containing protein [Acidobacteriota bacterium]